MQRWQILILLLVIGLTAKPLPAADAPEYSASNRGGHPDERNSDGLTRRDELLEPPAQMARPAYEKDGSLKRPQRYAQWVFVGASLGLRYDEDEKHNGGVGYFHNVYMQPEAFRHYVRTGYFPDKTMFVMESYRPARKESINRSGYFEQELVGVEAAVKDYDRFELGWAYFNFSGPGGLAEKAPALPRALCWDCHAEHGADDNVFTQFYPIIRRAREQTAP
jgi:hypothetical protein